MCWNKWSVCNRCFRETKAKERELRKTYLYYIGQVNKRSNFWKIVCKWAWTSWSRDCNSHEKFSTVFLKKLDRIPAIILNGVSSQQKTRIGIEGPCIWCCNSLTFLRRSWHGMSLFILYMLRFTWWITIVRVTDWTNDVFLKSFASNL